MQSLRPQNSYDHYYRFNEIEGILKGYAETYPDYVRLSSLAKTAQGRDVWLLELTNTATGAFEEKAGYCVMACIHAAEVTGMMSVMLFLDHLLSNRKSDPKTEELLAKYTIYAIPVGAPDGMEYFYNNGAIRSGLEAYPPVKVKPAGVYPEDIDGDGSVRLMRIKDPNGVWKVSTLDDRLMVRRDYDEVKGDFYSVFTEGRVVGSTRLKDLRDCDPWDDPLHMFRNDFNRDFPLNWKPFSQQPGAGQYPLRNVETKAIADLLVDHKNIGSFASYHVDGGFFLYPPSGCSPKEADRGDITAYRNIGQIATEETGYEAVNIFETFGGHSYGGLDDYVYGVRGVFCCSIEAWDSQIRAGVAPKWKMALTPKTPKEFEMAEYKQLQWTDAECPAGSFKRWEKMQHPELGEVEVGGYDWRWVLFNPPTKFLYQEAEKQARFMFRHTMCLPAIEIEELNVTKRHDRIYDVEAVVINKRYLPTNVTNEAIKMREVTPDALTLSGAECLGGELRQSIGFLPGTSCISAIPAHGKWRNFGSEKLAKSVKWSVRAEPGTEITVTATSQRGGKDTRTAILD